MKARAFDFILSKMFNFNSEFEPFFLVFHFDADKIWVRLPGDKLIHNAGHHIIISQRTKQAGAELGQAQP